MNLPGLTNLMSRSRPAPAPTPIGNGKKPARQTPEEFAALINRRYELSRRAKSPLLRTWATCLAFYAGEHWRRWDRRAQRLVEPAEIPSWRVLITDNQILGAVTLGAAKLARAAQVPRALPSTGEQDDILSAQAGTNALKHWWAVDRMEQRMLEANIQRIIFGGCFLVDYWDPSKSARIPTTDDWGKQTTTRAAVGDVCCRMRSVFHGFPEPGITDWDDLGWFILSERHPVSWVRDRFPDAPKTLDSSTPDDESILSWLIPGSSAYGAMQGSSERSGDANPDEDGFVTILTYYEKPSLAYPQGRHGINCGKTLLWPPQDMPDQLPDAHRQIPVSMFSYIPCPERLWPIGNVESLLGPQRELNLVESYEAENIRLHGRPRLIVTKEARIPKEDLTSSPDQHFEPTTAGGPEPVRFLQPPNMPVWINERPEKIRAAINQLSGLHEVSQATSPVGVTAASAIRLLQEADDTRMAVPALVGKDGLQRLSEHVLKTIVDRYREPRLIRLEGKSKAPEVQVLMGADIGDLDVLVNVTEGVADSTTVKTEDFRAWWQLQVPQGMLSGQIPWSFGARVLQELDEQWLLDALEAGKQEIDAKQQAQAEAAQEAAAANAQAGVDGQQQDAAAQQMQAEQAQAAAQGAQKAALAEQKAQRDHELNLAVVKAVLQKGVPPQSLGPAGGAPGPGS